PQSSGDVGGRVYEAVKRGHRARRGIGTLAHHGADADHVRASRSSHVSSLRRTVTNRNQKHGVLRLRNGFARAHLRGDGGVQSEDAGISATALGASSGFGWLKTWATKRHKKHKTGKRDRILISFVPFVPLCG